MLSGAFLTTKDHDTARALSNHRAAQKSALEKQVGGSHYKGGAIQPFEFCHSNGMGLLEGNVVKYVTRYKNKNGKQDLEKAIHCLEVLIELEYGNGNDTTS